MKSRIPDIAHSSEEIKDLPPTIFLYNSGHDEAYATEHYVIHYTHRPSVFFRIPLQSLKRYYKTYWYDTQVMIVLGNAFNPRPEAITMYGDAFCESVDLSPCENTKKLWEDYASGLMKEFPEHGEVKKEFDGIPKKLHGATNEKAMVVCSDLSGKRSNLLTFLRRDYGKGRGTGEESIVGNGQAFMVQETATIHTVLLSESYTIYGKTQDLKMGVSLYTYARLDLWKYKKECFPSGMARCGNDDPSDDCGDR
ncbi:MAG: hypothetical protein U9N35_02300 [Euryarchaeota archaeon]|nr:hypothetical protein [Euryarchaeota archaeon]